MLAQGGLAVVVDITARRQGELLAGRCSGSGFEEVFEQAPIATGLLDTEGRWLLVNRALCDMTGYTAQEMIGNRLEGIVHPEDAERGTSTSARRCSTAAAGPSGSRSAISTPPGRPSR